jgi:type IV secretory pathway VirJ component
MESRMKRNGLKWFLVLPAVMFFLISFVYNTRGGEVLHYGHFGTVPLYGDTKTPEEVVLFVSGEKGWNEDIEDIAIALTSPGTLVIGIDIVHYVKSFDDSSERCIYPAGDFEMLSQFVQKKLGISSYHHPILVGYSSGAALVYATLVQAPNTFPGAISLGFTPDLLVSKPLCKGDGLLYTTEQNNKGFILKPAINLGTPWVVLQGETDQVYNVTAAENFVNQVAGGRIVRLRNVGHDFSITKNWIQQFREAFKNITHLKPATPSTGQSRLRDLPLVELRSAASGSSLLAVIISGDGGWAGIDSDMGDFLLEKGISVVGLDSLKYFWNPKTPDGTAIDLERILRYYGEAWKKQEFLLIGYSRGADVFPFLVDRLPKDLRDRVKLIALLGLSNKVAFEFHLSDWISGTSDSGALPIRPEIEKLKGMKILCFCGESEDNSLCRTLDDGLVETIVMKGGHHFDGDYHGIIDQVLVRLK